MPYSMDKLPPQAQKLNDSQKKKFISIVNAMIKEGEDEGTAIATAIKKAKEASDMSEFFEGQWVEVFRAGKQTDSSGHTKEWTEEDLSTIVSKYNNQEGDLKGHEAPIVIGHPKENAPAFGWVEKLKTDGKIVFAKFKQLVPEFLEAVEKGMYKKRSISLYPDLTLRHIGFLGAVPPAIKGLKDIAFNNPEEAITFEFNEEFKFNSIARILDGLRDYLIDKHDLETADRIAPQYLIDDLKRQDGMYKENNVETKGEDNMKLEELQKSFDELSASFKALETKTSELETKNTDLVKENEDLIKKVDEYKEAVKKEEKPIKSEFEEAAEKRIKEIENQLAIAEKKNRIANYKEFVKDLHSKGKVVSESQNLLVDFMEAIHEVGKFNFAEGESDVLDTFKNYLTNQPQIVEFKEVNTDKQKQEAQSDAITKLNAFAEQIAKEEKIGFSEALCKAQEQHPDLANIAATEL